jgi:hypothetical protein
LVRKVPLSENHPFTPTDRELKNHEKNTSSCKFGKSVAHCNAGRFGAPIDPESQQQTQGELLRAHDFVVTGL